MKRITLTLIILSLVTNQAMASVGSDLNHYFDQLGLQGNVTAPSAYQGQRAGFYSGGSLYARTRVRNVQIAQVELPSFRAGCGGIDAFTGGFSFINSQELVSLGKNILNNAAGYAFNLALQTATPQIANTMNYLQSMANKVNQANVDSCETAAGLVGSMWPRTQVAQQQVCADVGASTGLFADWAQAKQGCGAQGRMDEALNRGKADNAYKHQILSDTNIAWQAIQKNDFLQRDKSLAELFLSLSGTIIVTKNPSDKQRNQFKVLSSLATDKSLIHALLHGGQAQIYHCNSDTQNACLQPTIAPITISTNNALETKVKQLLAGIIESIYQDKPLTKPQIALLQTTRIPLYKMLNVQAALKKDKAILDIANYIDLIAQDMLYQYLTESLSVIKRASSSLQYPKDILSRFQQGIDNALARVNQQQLSNYQRMEMTQQLIAQTQTIEQGLASNLSNQFNQSLNWARGMH